MLRRNENFATASNYINEGIYSFGLGFIF
jgi:hypothetical protein